MLGALLTTILAVTCFSGMAWAAGVSGERPSPTLPYPQHINSVSLTLPGGGAATIYYGESVIYLESPTPAGRENIFAVDHPSVSGQVVVKINDRLAVSNKYVKLPDGSTGRIAFRSSDPTVAKVFNGDSGEERFLQHKAGELSFVGPGKVTITASIADPATGSTTSSVNIPLEVRRIPLWRGLTKDDLVAVLGLPDAQTSGHVEWPKSQIVDGVFYDPKDPSGIFWEHWFYRAYPGVVFRLDVGYLIYAYQRGWNQCETLLFLLEQSDPNPRLFAQMIAETNRPLPYCGWESR
jgi:hypothetical protein